MLIYRPLAWSLETSRTRNKNTTCSEQKHTPASVSLATLHTSNCGFRYGMRTLMNYLHHSTSRCIRMMICDLGCEEQIASAKCVRSFLSCEGADYLSRLYIYFRGGEREPGIHCFHVCVNFQKFFRRTLRLLLAYTWFVHIYGNVHVQSKYGIKMRPSTGNRLTIDYGRLVYLYKIETQENNYPLSSGGYFTYLDWTNHR